MPSLASKERPDFWGHNSKDALRQATQEWPSKVPFPLKKRHGSLGREQCKKRIELTGRTASFLDPEIALPRPNSLAPCRRSFQDRKQLSTKGLSRITHCLVR